jgi:hypothetical protein
MIVTNSNEDSASLWCPQRPPVLLQDDLLSCCSGWKESTTAWLLVVDLTGSQVAAGHGLLCGEGHPANKSQAVQKKT